MFIADRMQNTNTVAQAHSSDLFTRIRPLLSSAFDWLTIEPIWRSYRRFNNNVAAAVGFGLILVWYVIFAFPFVIFGALLSVMGIIAEDAIVDTIAPLALLAAVVMTAYGGYQAWSLLKTRQTTFGYAQNPNLRRVIDSFDYLHHDDRVTREFAANAIGTGIETDTGRVIGESALKPDEIIFEIVDLLHDRSVEVRRHASEALVHLTEECPEEVAKYRDDIYSGISYPDPVVQSNCVLVAGFLAYYEPALDDEVIQYVSAIIDDPDPEVRVRLAIALGMIPNEKSRELLRTLSNDSNKKVRQEANKCLS